MSAQRFIVDSDRQVNDVTAQLIKAAFGTPVFHLTPNRALARSIDSQKVAFLVVAFMFCKAGHCFKVTRERGFHLRLPFGLFYSPILKPYRAVCQRVNLIMCVVRHTLVLGMCATVGG
nr:MAG TPA: hypothetical protein [Caudoviricetes sp.]